MRDYDECRPYIDHLVAEHRRLHGMLRRIRASLVNSVEPGGEPSFAEVTRILRGLRDELEHHFAQEESGGCLDEAVSRCPKLSAEARRIEAEHAELLAEIDSLIAQAKTQEPTAWNQVSLQRAFDGLFQRLRAHEKAENELVGQAFGTSFNGDDNEQPSFILDD